MPGWAIVFAVVATLEVGTAFIPDRRSGGPLLLRGSDAPLDLSLSTQLSTSPRVYQYEGFLSSRECDHIVEVVKRATHDSLQLPSGRFLRKYQDPVIRRVEERIASWLFPHQVSHESARVLRYNEGQTYDVHFEFFSDPTVPHGNSERAAAVVLFLSDVAAGGELVFPLARVSPSLQSAAARGGGSCNKSGLVVTPKKGAALLVFRLSREGSVDAAAEYSECPVEEGEQWVATKWVQVLEFAARRDVTVCRDEHSSCLTWAREGECEKNPKYMVGHQGLPGLCRKACKACS